MGNENSTPVKIAPTVPKYRYRSNFRIWYLPNEIWFEILAFVKFHESPNLFLVNSYLLPICQEFFHSGNVGNNKIRNVRDLKMELIEDKFTIFVKRYGKYEFASVPEIDPPKIFKSFGNIRVGNCCRIQAMQFLIKFQALINEINNGIVCKRTVLETNNAGNLGLFQFFNWIWTQIDENRTPIVDERQFFFDWLDKKNILLQLEVNNSSPNICRVLAEPIMTKFNGVFMMVFKNEENLCEEDSKLIYEWISGSGDEKSDNRWLEIHHFDAKKAFELVYQIAKLFENEHYNKVNAKKMSLIILLPEGSKVPNQFQKIYNIHGDQLATLRTFSVNYKGLQTRSEYVFYTKSMEYIYENKEEMELVDHQIIYFE